jgi:membrane fusion protein (multidrug efflux system)
MASGRRGQTSRLIIIALVVVIALGAGTYWFVTRNSESTDDAFTDGRAIMIAPKVSGYVVKLAVGDNQRLKAGDRILEIDPADYQIARNRAAANLGIVEAQLASARQDLDIAKVRYPADLASAEADKQAAEATAKRAGSDFERQTKVDIRATTEQQVDAAREGAKRAAASLADADARLRIARAVPQNIAIAEAKVAQWEAQAALARADLAKAELDLKNTVITAPEDGWVTKRNVEIGTYLQPGTAVMALVSPQVWITANFKESQLKRMRPGQRVDISIDAYPQLKLVGKVDSIQMGTGARFSAFPAENATGNFVKIVQRLPVKIDITEGLDPNLPLPLGLSVDPNVTLE